LLGRRRGRYFQKDKRCDFGKNNAVNDSHEVIKQLYPLGIKATRGRVYTAKAMRRGFAGMNC